MPTCCTLLLVSLWMTPVMGQDVTPSDEQVLQANRVDTSGEGLLTFFKARTINPDAATRLKELIKQLGDEDFTTRENASKALIVLGSRARTELIKASKDPDPEVAERARDCLKQISEGGSTQVVLAALRALASKKPATTAEVLLDYLPTAEQETVTDDTVAALAAVASSDGKPNLALQNALKDALPLRRMAAGIALTRSGVQEAVAASRKLLNDSDSSVRFGVGLAFASLPDREAIPTLIQLLDSKDLKSSDLSQIEGLLYRIAENRKPPVLEGYDPSRRGEYQKAWLAWWKDNEASIKPELLAGPRILGNTLVVLLDEGEILDLDSHNQPRFRLKNLVFPLDAQYLPGDRVLVAEHHGSLVTERDRDNKIVWKKEIDEPLVAQRLPNGNTFITTRESLFEFDREGKQVFSYIRPNVPANNLIGGDSIMRAQRLPNGEIVMIANPLASRFIRLDPQAKKELANFPVNVRTSGGRIEVLPNGNVLLPENDNNRVVEYNPQGKIVWELKVDQPIAAVRLPNGNTLVTTMLPARGAIEFDRNGREVWNYKASTRVTRAYRR